MLGCFTNNYKIHRHGANDFSVFAEIVKRKISHEFFYLFNGFENILKI